MRGKAGTWIGGVVLVAVGVGFVGTPGLGAAPIAGFEDTVVLSGLNTPTAIEWGPDGRIFVAEKSGRIIVFDGLNDSTPTLFADLSSNTFNSDDLGLLGLEIDPQFPTQPYVYALYTHNSPIGGESPLWPGMELGIDDACPNPPGALDDGCVVSGRLSRLTAEAEGSTMTGQELVLIEDWCQQYTSHSIGSVKFGPDGFLHVSGGEGASWSFVDYGQEGNPVNPCNDPPVPSGTAPSQPTAEGGALRAQDILTSTDTTGLGGTLIRIDRDGNPAPGNPFFDSGTDANARRIVAAGLRNPFRFAFRPDSSELWIGDVGWNMFEELNLLPSATTYRNFGWPCREGNQAQTMYGPLDFTLCDELEESDTASDPYFTYEHDAPLTTGEACPFTASALAGLDFEQGANFPASFDGALFFTDYNRRCIWVIHPGDDGGPDPDQVSLFATLPSGAVELEFGPDGALYWVEIAGAVHRIDYSANESPTATIVSSPLTGPTPLTVHFDGTGSFDPEGGSVTHAWDLDGDGSFDDSNSATPSWTYRGGAPVTVGLRAVDPVGRVGTASIVVSPFAPMSRDTVMLVDAARAQWHALDLGGRPITSFYFGNPGDTPLAGDWDCDGVATPGLYRRSDGFVYLRNSNTQGIADIRFFFGNPGDVPIAGDFDADGCDSISIYRPSEQRFHIVNSLGSDEDGLGPAEFSFLFGNPGDKPFVGDFDGDGIFEVGLHRESTGLIYYRNTLTSGIADNQFFFGDPGDQLVAGDWGVVDEIDTPGLFRPSNTTFYFRHSNTEGHADSQFIAGEPAFLPVAGDFGTS
jgi:glucose/arabinose dehydrogenase